jgi:ABC-type Mn2+/Zn2+ transport system permease subunit
MFMLEQWVNFCSELSGKLPFECMQYDFMQYALLAIILLAPLTAAAGVQVVNFRMAFFADTIGHSVFAGAALGMLLAGANGSEVVVAEVNGLAPGTTIS